MKEINNINIDRLVFRRQYLLGPKPFKLNRFWSSYKFGSDLFLSIHCDLSYVSIKNDKTELVLLGSAFDPHHPQHDNKTILRSLFKHSSNLLTLIEATTPLAGRWIIFLKNNDGIFLFSDPCGFRQTFYTFDYDQIWCGSQPEIIKQNRALKFTKNPKINRLLLNKDFAAKESSWLGIQTIYDNCFHLMPNHYLDINNRQQVRFYPNKPFQIKEKQKIISSAAELLFGIIESITNRHKVKFALTSGWDSRLLLAASKKQLKNIEYFIDRKEVLPLDHPDVVIPERLAQEFNFNFIIKNSIYTLPGWFVSILSHNITGARILPKTQMIYDYLIHGEERVNINGNAGEIFRNLYDNYYEHPPTEVYISDMVKAFGYKSQPRYVCQEFEKWSNKLLPYLNDSFYLLDFLHWEQRLGNWGAQFPAEQDIAIEEVSPLNCRELYNIMLSSPRNVRGAPDYPLIKDLIEYMWPELLNFPFNRLLDENLDIEKKNDMQVSIIIPVFNAEKFIKKAVESALIQPETSEVVLVEDGSSDNSLKICEKIAQNNSKVKLFQHKEGKNRGAAASRNLAMQKSSCEYIAFLDADDYFLPDRFRKAKEVFFNNANCEGVYEAAGIAFDNEDAKKRWLNSNMKNVELTTMTRRVPPEELFEKLACGGAGYFSIIGLTIKRTVLERSGLMNEKLKLHQDTDFIFRLSAVGKLLPGSLDEPIVIRRVHSQNRISAPRSKKQKYKDLQKTYTTTYLWCRKNRFIKESKYIFEILLNNVLEVELPNNLRNRFSNETQRKIKLLLWATEFPYILLEKSYWKALFPKLFNFLHKIKTKIFQQEFKPLQQIKKLFRYKKEIQLLQKTELFDKKYYLDNNPDVANSKIDPYKHFLLFGGFEGRNPSANFDSRKYMTQNPDVSKAKLNPLVHYLTYGKKEGRPPK